MKKIYAILLTLTAVLFLAAGETFAQNKVSGRVTDENGEPLAGASVMIQGSHTGTVTDLDGKWSIQAKAGQTLVVSFIGYTDAEIPVTAARAVYDVALNSDQNFLDDVVVVGYGTQKKVNLTGSVSSVSSEMLEKRPIVNTSTALQGIAAGVTVTTQSGAPGGDGGTVRVRGLGTFGQSSAAPLILIDGVQGSMTDIDASQIDKISVLKDAASSAIYGSRAANGVILITTKRGSKGKTSVTYRGYAGFQSPTDLPELVNVEEFMTLNRESSLNDGTTPAYTEEYIQNYRQYHYIDPDNYPLNDWQALVLTGSGFLHNHNLTMTASTDKVQTRTTLNYLSQDGIITTADYHKWNLRNNMNVKFSDQLGLRFDLAMVYSDRNRSPNQSTIFNYMNTRDPINPGRFSTGYFAGVAGTTHNILPYLEGSAGNINSKGFRVNGALALTWKPFSFLTLEGTAAPRLVLSNTHNYKLVTQLAADPFGSPGLSTPAYNELNESVSYDYYGTYQFTTTFDKTFGSHNIKLLGGYSYEDLTSKDLSLHRQNFAYPDYDVISAGADDETKDNGGTMTQWALQSFFGRFNYNYKERYLFEANVRVDGSSRFKGANRYVTFPSASFGWRVSEEPFMQPLQKYLTEFKFRASYGTLGNQSIGSNYPTVQTLAVSSISVADKAILPIVTLTSLANEKITWETARMVDFGVDFALFNKLDVTFDWYHKVTDGVLLTLPIPKTIGLSAPYQNAAQVTNTGWELTLGYHDRKGNWNWGIDANLSDVDNRITALPVDQAPSDNIVHKIGYPINSIFGYECIGIARTQEEADYVNTNQRQFGADIKAGDLVYKDVAGALDEDGNPIPDGLVNEDDRVVIGSCIPRYTFGVTLNLGWKGWNLSAFFQGVGKVDGLLTSYYVMPNTQGGTYRKEHLNRWTVENPDEGYYPRMSMVTSNNNKISSFWVRDAAYCRLKNLQLSYTLPKKAVKKIGLGGVMLFANAQNLLTLTNFYQGYDPEVNFSGDGDGVTLGSASNYPQVKTFTAGVEIKF